MHGENKMQHPLAKTAKNIHHSSIHLSRGFVVSRTRVSLSL